MTLGTGGAEARQVSASSTSPHPPSTPTSLCPSLRSPPLPSKCHPEGFWRDPHTTGHHSSWPRIRAGSLHIAHQPRGLKTGRCHVVSSLRAFRHVWAVFPKGGAGLGGSLRRLMNRGWHSKNGDCLGCSRRAPLAVCHLCGADMCNMCRCYIGRAQVKDGRAVGGATCSCKDIDDCVERQRTESSN